MSGCASHIGTLWNIGAVHPNSVCLGAGELDHLGPLFGFVGQELAELGRRAGDDLGTKVAEPRLCLRSAQDGKY